MTHLRISPTVCERLKVPASSYRVSQSHLRSHHISALCCSLQTSVQECRVRRIVEWESQLWRALTCQSRSIRQADLQAGGGL